MKRTERSPTETATKVWAENDTVHQLYNRCVDICQMGTPGWAIHLQAACDEHKEAA